MHCGLIENTKHKSIIILPSFESPNMKWIFEWSTEKCGEESVSNLRKFNYAEVFLEKPRKPARTLIVIHWPWIKPVSLSLYVYSALHSVYSTARMKKAISGIKLTRGRFVFWGFFQNLDLRTCNSYDW